MIKPEPTGFLIADISGYTEYLSGVEIDHAQDILADANGPAIEPPLPRPKATDGFLAGVQPIEMIG